MKPYVELVRRVMTHGERRPDRTEVGTLSLFGEHCSFDLRAENFPATTVKRLAFNQVKGELAAFLRGAQNVQQFRELGCRVWDGNAAADYWLPRAKFEGDLGRIYGVQWRDWQSVSRTSSDGSTPRTIKRTDQLNELIRGLLHDPYGRRHLLTTYNPGELDDMCLPPCHLLFQVSLRHDPVTGEGLLSGHLYMRSLDLFLGAPFDIASYALLLHLLCRELAHQPQATDAMRLLVPGHLHLSVGDAHVYLNHVEQVDLMLSRPVLPHPRLDLGPDCKGVFDFHPDQARLIDYHPAAAISAPLNV